MSLTSRGSATYYDSSSSSSGTINKVSGVVDGDLMFAMVTSSNTLTTIPTGWNLITRRIDSSNGHYYYIFYKIANSEPTSYTWGFASSSNVRIVNTVFYGDFDTNDPIFFASQEDLSTSNVSFLAPFTCPAIYFISISSSSSRTFTPATDFTEIDDSGSSSSDYYGEVALNNNANGLYKDIRATVSGSVTSQTASIILVRPSGTDRKIPRLSFSLPKTYRTASGNTVTYTAKNIKEGDLMFFFMGITSISNAPTVTIPSGWNLLSKTSVPLNNGIYTYYKVATSSDVGCNDYTWTFSENLRIYYTGFSIRTNDLITSNPIYNYSDGSYTNSDKTIRAYSINGGKGKCLLALYFYNPNSYSISSVTVPTVPSTFSQFVDFHPSVGLDIAFNILNWEGSGVTGDADIVVNGIANTSQKQGLMIAINTNANTGTNTQINIGDTWKEVESIKINIGDSWKDVESAQINIGDSWKTIY